MAGFIHSTRRFLDQAFPPKPTFDPQRDIPDLSGKVAIVTGGNSGIGKETVKQLLLKNARVYMASRSRDSAEQAIQELKQQTGKEAIFLELDLANLDKVTKAYQEFKSKESELHLLFNSAGTLEKSMDRLTDDGYDLQFGTNVLGPAHFTLLLIPELTAGARSSSDGRARVINTSSYALYFTHPGLIDWNSLKDDTPERRKLDIIALYNQSKYAVMAFSNELARRFGDQGITSNALNPGACRTALFRRQGAVFQWFVSTFLAYPTEKGALTPLYVATSTETKDANGDWFIPFARSCPHDQWTRNTDMESKLWDWIQEQRKGHY